MYIKMLIVFIHSINMMAMPRNPKLYNEILDA